MKQKLANIKKGIVEELKESEIKIVSMKRIASASYYGFFIIVLPENRNKAYDLTRKYEADDMVIIVQD